MSEATCALDPEAPVEITEGALTWIALTTSWGGANLRLLPDTCDTCGAHGDQPCRTRGGNDARQWHRGRG